MKKSRPTSFYLRLLCQILLAVFGGYGMAVLVDIGFIYLPIQPLSAIFWGQIASIVAFTAVILAVFSYQILQKNSKTHHKSSHKLNEKSNKKGYRQLMASVHTWFGVLAGWLLFVVFLMGTVSFLKMKSAFGQNPNSPINHSAMIIKLSATLSAVCNAITQMLKAGTFILRPSVIHSRNNTLKMPMTVLANRNFLINISKKSPMLKTAKVVNFFIGCTLICIICRLARHVGW